MIRLNNEMAGGDSDEYVIDKIKKKLNTKKAAQKCQTVDNSFNSMEKTRKFSSSFVLNELGKQSSAVRNISQPTGASLKSLKEIRNAWKLYIKFESTFNTIDFYDRPLPKSWFCAIVYIEKESINIFPVQENSNNSTIKIMLSTCYIFDSIKKIHITEFGPMKSVSLCKLSKKYIINHKIRLFSEDIVSKSTEKMINFGSRNVTEIRNFILHANDSFRFSCNFCTEIIENRTKLVESFNNFAFLLKGTENTDMVITSTGKIESSQTSIRMILSYLRMIDTKNITQNLSGFKFRLKENNIIYQTNKRNSYQFAFCSNLTQCTIHQLCHSQKNENGVESYCYNVQLPMADSEICLVKLDNELYKTFPIKVRGIIDINEENSVNLIIDVHMFQIQYFLPFGKCVLRIPLPETWSAIFTNLKSQDSYISFYSRPSGIKVGNDRCMVQVTRGGVEYDATCTSLLWDLDWMENFVNDGKFQNSTIENLTCKIKLPFDVKKPDNFRPYVEVEVKSIKVTNPILEVIDLYFYDGEKKQLCSNSLPNTVVSYSRSFLFKYYIAVREDNDTRETWSGGDGN